MIVDFNAHFGKLPGRDEAFAADDLRTMAQSAGIDRVVAADAGALVPYLRVLLASGGSSAPAGTRLYPTYAPRDSGGIRLAGALSHQPDRIVHVCLRLRDPRILPQTVALSEIITALSQLVEANPRARFVVSGAVLAEVSAALDVFRLPNVWTETSHLQHPMNSLRKLVDVLGAERVVFGTNAPFFYPEAAVFRLRHAGLSERERRLVESENALGLLDEVGIAAVS
jgi:hypothetical protein